MDLQRMRKTAITGGSSLVELPEYIITSFLPGARPLLEQYPFLFRFFGVILALYYFGPIARLKSLWTQFSSMIVATINVSSDEDLFGYLTSWISDHRTLRADQVLNAMSNTPQDTGRRRVRHHDPDVEETKRMNEPPKIKYEQGQGTQLFVHKKRLFFCSRQFGEGHTYFGNRYKRMEIISISCLGRTTQPIKDLIEHIYFLNKARERSLTIIRRPYRGGQTWSRVTSKPRRALDTVILELEQKEKVLADVAEYMDQATMTFYANHGIPYRRGYLFHGPPGVGKTSFALAIASKFNLDVYNLSLLDNDLTDSDLISLLNQLPGRSLLLLEDIDTAGLNRKGKSTTAAARRGGPSWASGLKRGQGPRDADDYNVNDDDEAGTNSRVTLSGLLNAIDGVAAPERHVLIMRTKRTTNKPNELDDALVRAGRISVRVGFKNASKRQAEEIFLRMFIDLPTSASLRGMEEAAGPVTPTEDEKPKDELGLRDHGEETTRLRGLAEAFAALVPEDDFSPADLQDYLLMHKKDPQKAVDEAKGWMEKVYEERKRKSEEQKEQKEAWREEKRKDIDRFREEVKAAVRGLSSEEDEAKQGRERDDKAGDDKKDMTP
ncbi:mitochondrial chaperone BCS1 [Cladophialophora carrionii]|uniref:Mitochondrial chaperone BCS1 n=1 Tax=Cladophialophora carrionii TaxID=86049 RepID=A0A1C1CXI8_9EURO|nr:mitochondrial chaperone BCS1 [Cladophialophora carrionii]